MNPAPEQTLERLKERARKQGYKHVDKNGDILPVWYSFPEEDLNSLITEVWNEAIKECEGYKKALEDINSVTPADAERWGYYETINKIVGRANEALLPRADITSDKPIKT